jgi:hypothetical protein
VIEPSELALAEIRHEFRALYHCIGFDGTTQVLYEMLKAAEILSEVMMEESAKDKGVL